MISIGSNLSFTVFKLNLIMNGLTANLTVNDGILMLTVFGVEFHPDCFGTVGALKLKIFSRHVTIISDFCEFGFAKILPHDISGKIEENETYEKEVKHDPSPNVSSS